MKRSRPATPRPGVKPGPPKLDLTIHSATGKQYVRFLRKHLLAAHALLNPPLADLSLALVGDRQMSTLHQQFMKIAGPTDVLTFPLEVDVRGRETAGEVVVCVPEAARQARIHQSRVDHELLLYALHGMLHLCGFDDRTKKAFRQMHRMENDILVRLGLGPVFGTVNPDDADRKSSGEPKRTASRSGGKAQRRKASPAAPRHARPRPRAMNERVGA